MTAPAVLFTLDNDESYAVNDALDELHRKAFGDNGASQEAVDMKIGAPEAKASRRRSYIGVDGRVNADEPVIVRQVQISLPAFTFEINKSINAGDYLEAQEDNIEAIYGMLSIKLFGIGI